ncbi:MAG: maleylacetoacetate isomerase [Devosia sp.]|nr:maleylacetoacetate isomerase [Devosia sp.]
MQAWLRLYSASRNSAGWRVRIALALKGIDYEYVSTRSLAAGEYRRINPQGLMPSLEIEGRLIAQSAAILELIEELYPNPPLLPEDALDRATARSFAQLITADLHPLNNNRVRKYLANVMGQNEVAVAAWYRHWSITALAALEEMLHRRERATPFCFGDTAGWADLHLVPQLYNCRRSEVDLAPYPLLLAADAACQISTSFAEAAPERMPDFTGDDPPWRQA